MNSDVLPEHARVRLLGRLDAPEGAVMPGSEGTVIYCYADGRTYEIEFVHNAPVLATLRYDEVERI